MMDERLDRLTFWCQKVLPLVYDDSLSYYELLCKVVKYLNDLIDNQNLITQLLGQHGNDIAKLKKDVTFLKDELEKVKNGDYVSLYIDALSAWIDKNLQELVAKIVTYVFFQLDDSGHFVAYIPESWQFLQFDTVMNTEDKNYGHLVLEW